MTSLKLQSVRKQPERLSDVILLCLQDAYANNEDVNIEELEQVLGVKINNRSPNSPRQNARDSQRGKRASSEYKYDQHKKRINSVRRPPRFAERRKMNSRRPSRFSIYGDQLRKRMGSDRRPTRFSVVLNTWSPSVYSDQVRQRISSIRVRPMNFSKQFRHDSNRESHRGLLREYSRDRRVHDQGNAHVSMLEEELFPSQRGFRNGSRFQSNNGDSRRITGTVDAESRRLDTYENRHQAPAGSRHNDRPQNDTESRNDYGAYQYMRDFYSGQSNWSRIKTVSYSRHLNSVRSRHDVFPKVKTSVLCTIRNWDLV